MKRIALSLLFFTLCLCLLPGRAALAASPGWELLPEGWVYHEEDGSRRTGWLSWQGDWYYLDEQGVMQTGWVWSSPDWYWCGPSGRMVRNAGIDGWYIGKNGRMAGRAAPLGEADIAAVTAAAQWDGKPLGLYFEDLASGQSLLLGGEERYYLASVLKAPYCMWVYTLADAGKADLSQTVRYDASMRHGGSGVVKDFADGTEIPVADLLEYGINHAEVARRLYDSRPVSQVRATGIAICALKFYCGGKLAVINFTKKMREDNNLTREDIDDIISLTRSIEGVEVGMSIKQSDDDETLYKVSMRSNRVADVSLLCAKFGGGGHKRASGCTLNADSPDEAEARLVAVVSDELEVLMSEGAFDGADKV